MGLTSGPAPLARWLSRAEQVALLTIYDMCKAVDRGMTFTDCKLLEKHGGKSGSFVAGGLTRSTSFGLVSLFAQKCSLKSHPIKLCLGVAPQQFRAVNQFFDHPGLG